MPSASAAFTLFPAPSRNSLLGFGDLLIDPAQGAAGTVVAVPRKGAQPPRDGPAGSRRDTGILQHPQGIELADRLDDPRQHQLGKHLVPAGGAGEPQQQAGMAFMPEYCLAFAPLTPQGAAVPG